MQEQTRQALRNVLVILEASGSSLEKSVKVTVHLNLASLQRKPLPAHIRPKAVALRHAILARLVL